MKKLRKTHIIYNIDIKSEEQLTFLPPKLSFLPPTDSALRRISRRVPERRCRGCRYQHICTCVDIANRINQHIRACVDIANHINQHIRACVDIANRINQHIRACVDIAHRKFQHRVPDVDISVWKPRRGSASE